LHSIIPAPVRSRSSFTSFAVIDIGLFGSSVTWMRTLGAR
jgi:hypothetical protein